MEPPADAGAIVRPAWVLLPVEARLRGFRNALAFRRWCRSRGVPIRTDGRKQWVSPEDVDKAVAAIPTQALSSPAATTSIVDPVASAVATLMLQGRSR